MTLHHDDVTNSYQDRQKKLTNELGFIDNVCRETHTETYTETHTATHRDI